MKKFQCLVMLSAAWLALAGTEGANAADSLNVRTLGVWGYGPCRAAAGAWLSGHRYAVFSSGTRLSVMNIDDPSQPRLAGDLSLEAEITRIWVENDLAYVAAEGIGLALVDIADPALPVLRGSLQTAGTVTGARRFGDHLAVSAGAAGLLVADIADPAHPRLAGQCALPGTALGVAIDGSTAYVACGTNGLRAVNISDPAHPVPAGQCLLEGAASGIEIRGRHAYLSCGTGGIAVVNIDSLALSVRCPVSRSAFQLGMYRDYVIAADTAAGIRVVEVEDLRDIGQAGYYRLPHTACQLTVFDSLALVADSLNGLLILNLGGLYHRPVKSVWRGTDTAYAVSLSPDGLYAHLAAGYDGLRIFSMADHPPAPVELGHYGPGSRVYQLSQPVTYYPNEPWPALDRQYCLAAGDTGLILLDLADSSAPLELARERGAAPAWDVSMSYYVSLLPDTVIIGDDSIYLDTIRFAAVARGDSNVWFYGVSDSVGIVPWGPVPRNHPVFTVATYDESTNSPRQGFFCAGGNVLADYFGIGAWDSILQFRTRLTIATGGWVGPHATGRQEITPVGDSLVFFSPWGRGKTVTLPAAAGGGDGTWDQYAACAMSHGLQLLNGSNIGIGHWATPGQCRDAAMIGQYFLVADGTAGLQLADLSGPDTIREIGGQRMALSSCALAVTGTRAYLATADSGLWTLDWADSSRPRAVYYLNLPQTAFGLAVRESLLLAADGDAGLQILSLSDPDTPAIIGALALPGFALAVQAYGSLACVAADSAGLMVVDISNPAAPFLAGRYDSPGTAFGLAMDTVNQLALLADGVAGVHLLDISDPAAPLLVGGFDTPGYAFDVDVSGNRAFVADGGNGLVVIDVSDPVSPGPVGGLVTGGYARDLEVRDSIVFMADGPGGLSVINAADPARPVEVGYYRPGRQIWSAVPSGGRLFVLDDASSARLLWPFWLARQPCVPPEPDVSRFENRPNPFSERTVIQFRMGRSQTAKLSIYNIQGQLVRTLASGLLPAGSHRISWDGTSGNGRPLASGVYLCRLNAEDQTICRKIVLLR